ncbi:unnamed protein product [Symbiodinium sp. CCMP2456]|nr:unnamed protein product [Symbiodinium sp. CCMP2456]
MKKPAAAVLKSSQGNKPVKKDAEPKKGTKSGPLNSQLATWEKGVSSEESGRDKGKGEKWSKLVAQGGIEPHIIDLYQNPPKDQPKRKFRTDLINRYFVRQGDGSLLVNASDSWFSQAKSVYEDRHKTNRDNLTTRLVFIGRNFQNDEKAFERAVESGEVLEVEEDGVKYYGYKQMIKSVKKGARESMDFKAEKPMSKNDVKAIADLFSELKWKYVPSIQDRKKLDVDGKLPDSAEKLLQQAIATQDKMCKTAMAMLKSTLAIPDNLCKSLKSGYGTAQKHITWLQHVKSFHELPDSQTKLNVQVLDNYMYNVATDTKKFNDDIHQVQGLQKAKQA